MVVSQQQTDHPEGVPGNPALDRGRVQLGSPGMDKP